MDDTVKLGVLVPIGRTQWGPEADPRTLTGFAMRAENLGYDSLWVNDFLLTPRIEALTMLAAVAPLTSRVMLGTAALLPVLRRPVQAAQTLASIEAMQALAAGPPGYVAEKLSDYVAAGARHLAIRIATTSLATQLEQLEQIITLKPLLKGLADD